MCHRAAQKCRVVHGKKMTFIFGFWVALGFGEFRQRLSYKLLERIAYPEEQCFNLPLETRSFQLNYFLNFKIK